MVARVLGVVGAIAVSLLAALPALAAEAERDADAKAPLEPQAEGQQNLALGAQVGFYNPNGLALRAGFRPISLEAAAGWAPTLLSYGGDRHSKLKLIAPLELTPQLLLGDIQLGNKIHGAFRVGYRYNLTLGHGFTLGGQLSKRWGHLQLEGLWGLSVFPNAVDELREENVLPENTSFNFPPSVTWGLTVGLMYYP
jgi:hypothetical protein